MSEAGGFIEAGKTPTVKRPPRRLGPWTIGTWLQWAWWIGLVLFIFHDGVPTWLVVVVGSIAALLAVAFVGGLAWRGATPEMQRPVRVVAAAIHRTLSAGGTPLGAKVRGWTVGVFAAGLLLSPLDYSGLDFIPSGWRLSPMVVATAAVWLGLIWFWKSSRPDRAAEVGFGRAVAGVVAGVLLAASVLATQRTSHFECTQRIQTRDGSECVGDYVPAPGPDAFEVLLLAGLAATAFWVAASAALWAAETES